MRGAAGALGVGPWVGEAAALGVTPGVGVGEASGTATLIGSTSAPRSGSATAAIVPSGLIAIGPSSVPSFSGNGLSTPASAFSQYHAPVEKERTAIRPEPPGAIPSVKKVTGSVG